MVVFMDSFEGKAKQTGNPFQVVTLMEVRKKKDGTVMSKTVEFFVKDLDCSKLVCGDVVEPEFEVSEFLGGKSELVGLEFTGENVFAQWLE